MKFKGLMLAAAAATAATTAQAADLPVAPEPVDYVRICDAYGARFYYIPGTETCLRVGGRVRTQVTINNMLGDNNEAWGGRAQNGYTAFTSAYLWLDARTATEFGTLRSFAEIAGNIQTGRGEVFDLGDAWVQLGGFLMGYDASQFDFFTGSTFAAPLSRDWSDNKVQQIAYTASFGDGFSATISLEDPSLNRNAGSYAGTRYPDLVAALGVSQGWGEAQLAGALHHVRPAAVGTSEHLGWAIMGGVIINLPMLSSDSEIAFQAGYADGAIGYVTQNNGGTLNGVNIANSDYAGNSTSTAWSVGGGFFHAITDSIDFGLDGSYAYIDQAGTANDRTNWTVASSLAWEPVSGLEVGGTLQYFHGDVDNVGDYDNLAARFRVQRSF